MSHSLHWHAGARGRLLMFNLLVVSVTLAVSLVAILVFATPVTFRSRRRHKRWPI